MIVVVLFYLVYRQEVLLCVGDDKLGITCFLVSFHSLLEEGFAIEEFDELFGHQGTAQGP
jgi:hypothetical protein